MCGKTANNNHPLVSIIVLNWNGMAYLEKCLQSLMSITYPNYEVIVVDNGSSDGSPDMVKKDFKNVTLIANKRNLGFAKGNNVGIEASKGNLIVLLNNDVVVDPTWLSELVKATVDSPKIGMTSGIVLQSKPSDVVWSSGKRIDVFTGITWRIGYGEKFKQIEKVEDIDYFSGCALLVKKQIILKIGLLDEGYFFYGEDADWNFCARRAGFDCEFAPLAIVWHEGSATRKRIPRKGYYWYNRSAFRLYFKHFPLIFLFTAILFRLIILSLFEILLFRRPISHISLRIAAFGDTLSELNEIITVRRKIHCLGKLHLKIRFREFLKVVKQSVDFKADSSTRRHEVL